MAGSRTLVATVLLYDMLEDKALWVVKSTGIAAENMQPHKYEVIWDDNPAYAVYTKMAGPAPKVLLEKVITQPTTLQGDADA